MCSPKEPSVARCRAPGRTPRLGSQLAAYLVALMLTLLLTVASCGTNMQAVYEGDVRFEHCMALDWRVAPYRRQCWIEWVAFYTYGQTRDRVLHAQRRIHQIGQSPLGPPLPAGPPAGPSGPPAGPPAGGVKAPNKRCAGHCEALRTDCWRKCGQLPSCRKSCAASYTSCLRGCG